MRFTAWLNAEERAALRALAEVNQCSENFIVRMALRALLFGKPVPTYLRRELPQPVNSTAAHVLGDR